eukprot:1156567-Pelagomonas_calceolata.AAC.4
MSPRTVLALFAILAISCQARELQQTDCSCLHERTTCPPCCSSGTCGDALCMYDANVHQQMVDPVCFAMSYVYNPATQIELLWSALSCPKLQNAK